MVLEPCNLNYSLRFSEQTFPFESHSIAFFCRALYLTLPPPFSLYLTPHFLLLCMFFHVSNLLGFFFLLQCKNYAKVQCLETIITIYYSLLFLWVWNWEWFCCVVWLKFLSILKSYFRGMISKVSSPCVWCLTCENWSIWYSLDIGLVSMQFLHMLHSVHVSSGLPWHMAQEKARWKPAWPFVSQPLKHCNITSMALFWSRE